MAIVLTNVSRRVPAVVGALLAAAGSWCAQGQQVEIYGRLYPEVVHARIRGATEPGTPGLATFAAAPEPARFAVVKMDASNSRLGLRGEEPLGNGASAFFQIEQRILVDTGNPASAGLASRDTYVGLSSPAYGLLRLGSMDTVYKDLGDTLSFLGVSSGNFVSNSSVLAKQPFGTNAAGSFHLRRANSVWYESPEWRGLQALVQASPDEARTTSRDAWLLSAGVRYAAQPLYVALAAEWHNDTFGGSRNVPAALSNAADLSAHARDWSSRATLQYRVDDVTVESNVAYTRYQETGGAAGRFRAYRHWSGSLAADARIAGAWRAAAALDWAGRGRCALFGGVPCSTAGLEGAELSLGAAYYLSRRTALFALYSRLWNGVSAQYNPVDGFDLPVGAEVRQVALGLLHAF